MSKTFSKGWATLLFGFITGGGIILQHPDQLNIIFGAAVQIITAIVALEHDIQLNKINAAKILPALPLDPTLPLGGDASHVQ